jgi:primosomal protein N' (replication factor Y) (superfamily II helicase)
MRYVEIAVNTAVPNPFCYHVPPELEDSLSPGHLVRVAFGTAMQVGIVLEDVAKPIFETKPILELLDPEPVMTDAHLELGQWMSEVYLTPIGYCLWLMLPPGLTGRSTRRITLLNDATTPTDADTLQIVTLLREKKTALLKDVENVLDDKKARIALDKLAKQGIIQQESILAAPGVKSKTVRTVTLAVNPPPPIKSKKQRAIVDYLTQRSFSVDVDEVYAAMNTTSTMLKTLEKQGIVAFGERLVWRDSLADRDFIPSQPLTLTEDQQRVWEAIRRHTPPLTPPRIRRGEQPQEESIGNYRRWSATTNLWEGLKSLAREMRHEPTEAENLLWQHLRDKRLDGYKFRRQHSIGKFIVDFYCAEAQLVLEVDGEIHQYTQEEDALRQAFLEHEGYRVIRFTNQEILADVNHVLQQIFATSSLPKSDSPSLNSVRGSGGGVARKFLLHGVTGSGKTEIYLHAIAETLAQGRQAIFLVPEIALTPQTVRRVAERFPGNVAIVHGSLSHGERYDTWRRARMGEIGVIVGTRSALFTPLPDVGLIILDEEHDHSYKHQPPFNPPYYHARDVASRLADLNEAVLILGSATPDLEVFYQSQRGELRYLHLPERIIGHRQRITAQAEREGVIPRYQPLDVDAMMIDMPPINIVDMRAELKAGNRSIFSRELHTALTHALGRHEQIILFLNRRGLATYVFCRDCGYVASCDRCDMPMTYHRQDEALRCHHCGNTQPAPVVCPQCDSTRIRYFGAGTQQVEEELHRHFPGVRSVRWDADTADKPDLHEAILAQFTAHEADVLIGTQMIAKGLDIPMVTLVGVVNADPGLALPDFRANERAFQLLTQVAGRAGRGVLGGQVLIQTYQPEHASIVAAAQYDYAGFYQREMVQRRELGYPPFRRLARLLIQSKHPVNVQREAEDAAEALRQRIQRRDLTETTLMGPAPCFFARIDGYYRWHILLRSTDPLLALRDFPLRQGWALDIDPVDVL